MNETDWLRSADACLLLDHLFPQRGHDSTPEQPRQLRLYLAALCRIAWKRLPPVCRATTELAERIADGEMADRDHRMQVMAIAEAMTTAHRKPELLARFTDQLHAFDVVVPAGTDRRYRESDWFSATWMAFLPHWADVPNFRIVPAADHRADLVRCIFGNPFQVVPLLDDRHTTDPVRNYAQAMYAERNFANMPILADALEEAECTDPAILEHCREKADHARGCWVVDLIRRG